MIDKTQITRRDYSKLPHVIDMPNLLAVQIDSFRAFLQAELSPVDRINRGLQAVFLDIFPITDIHDNFSLLMVQLLVIGVGMNLLFYHG